MRGRQFAVVDSPLNILDSRVPLTPDALTQKHELPERLIAFRGTAKSGVEFRTPPGLSGASAMSVPLLGAVFQVTEDSWKQPSTRNNCHMSPALMVEPVGCTVSSTWPSVAVLPAGTALFVTLNLSRTAQLAAWRSSGFLVP